METLENVLNSPKKKMSRNDLIETILMIIQRILDYTSSLDQRTPSLFDKNYIKQEFGSDKLSTSCSSNDETSNIVDIDKENNYSLNDYLYFWVEKLEFNENLLILTMMNIDKLLSNEFILTNDNIKKILFTCMVITQKIYEDENFNDKDYAKLLEISAEDLINMEIKFLEYTDFSLYVSEEEFLEYKKKMSKMWKDAFSYISFD